MRRNPHALPDGPIFGPSFVLYDWLAFVDDKGRNCFETHTILQVIAFVRDHSSVNRTMEYANLLQKGAWA